MKRLCCCVDGVLNIPKVRHGSSMAIRRYRSYWHAIAWLFALLLCLTVLQALASMLVFVQCNFYIEHCLSYLRRDPCLKMTVPAIMAVVITCSMCCSCCCQSPKALSVFLFITVVGEVALGGYLASVDRLTQMSQHLKSHLLSSIKSTCLRSPSPTDLEYRACWHPYKSHTLACRDLNQYINLPCNASSFRAVESHYHHLHAMPYNLLISGAINTSTETVRRHTWHHNITLSLFLCLTDLENVIHETHNLYKTAIFTLNLVLAAVHFATAILVCISDVKRKNTEKLLALGHRYARRNLDMHMNSVTAPLAAGANHSEVSETDHSIRNPSYFGP